ncbi:MAG: metallophosphoesterase [Actinomycetota bacterium]
MSDSHLSVAKPEADRNWDLVVDHLAETRPDLVLHGGDISADGNDVIADLEHARAQLDRLPVPWLAVPGNHDLGDAEPEWALTRQRRIRYEQVFGDRFWVHELDRWRIVGVDSQAIASGHDDDEDSWAWMGAELATDRPTIVVLHRPVAPTAVDEPDTARRYLTEPQRSRFRHLLAGTGGGPSNVVAVITGHIHQWRSQVVDGVAWIWAPSTWAVIADDLQPTIGTKAVGLVELDLDAMGHARLVTPEGMDRNVVTAYAPRSAS